MVWYTLSALNIFEESQSHTRLFSDTWLVSRRNSSKYVVAHCGLRVISEKLFAAAIRHRPD